MTVNLLSLKQVKAQLGITNTTYDSSISSMLPIVSADVRRILSSNLSAYYSATYSSGSNRLNVYDGSINSQLAKFGHTAVSAKPLDMGDVVIGEGIPDDSYISGYDYSSDVYTISNIPTASGSYVEKTINIAQWPTISKMIWYKISGANTSSADNKAVQSETYGKISKTYSAREINKKWNYPQQLIDDLGSPFAKVG